ncbi:Nonribosomal peptide synthetase gloA [Amphibalanus amphitrite]|uniref:Nonribosomal peptide synthetase gloA n=1 Tax=Amphibalanus amphitrite TaxID=1232801 RepID=A0A6A4VKU6_AMPAM|nr:Nonribosomal peptide synthetase gloA [Amphibalanus amphitrite]
MPDFTHIALVLLAALSVAGAERLEDAVQGVPGQDYPIFAEVPDTGFSCDGRINGGYYSDPAAQCQAFHVCSNNIRYSFLCPNGTLFSQLYFVCDWWYNFDCGTAEQLYVLNEQLFTEQEFDGSQLAASLGIVVGGPPQAAGGTVVASGVRGVSSSAGGTVINGNGFGNSQTTVFGGNGNGNGGFINGNGNGGFINGNGNGNGFNGNGVHTGYGAPGNGKK